MRTMHNLWVTLLALLLISAGAGWWYTKPISLSAATKRAAELTSAALVDESTYATAHKLAQLATTPAEHTYAQSALRIADHQLALAFTSALRDVEAHPPALSPEALKIQDRLTKSQALLDSDQQRVTQLEAALATAPASQKDMVARRTGPRAGAARSRQGRGRGSEPGSARRGRQSAAAHRIAGA